METEEVMLGSINVEIKYVEQDKDVIDLHVKLRREQTALKKSELI